MKPWQQETIPICVWACIVGVVSFITSEGFWTEKALEKQAIHQQKLDEAEALDDRLKKIEATQQLIKQFLNQVSGGH